MPVVAGDDPALAPGDPTRTIHFAVTRLVGRWIGKGDDFEKLFAADVKSDDPEWRDDYLWFVACSWIYAGAMFHFAAAGVAIPLGVFVNDHAGVAVYLIFGLGAGFFCLAGAVNVYWRKAAYVPEARVHEQSPGRSDAFARAMYNTLPRNSSVLFQAAVGLVAVGIALVLSMS